MALVVPDDSYASVEDVGRRIFQEIGPATEPSTAGTEAELRLAKKRIDGALRKLGAPFDNSDGEAVSILSSIQIDIVVEKISPLQLSAEGRIANTNAGRWRDDLAAIRRGEVDMGLDEDTPGGFQAFIAGKSYAG